MGEFARGGMTTGIGIMCFMIWEIMLFGDL